MLEKHLTGLRDPRRAQGQRYKLKDLLLVSILAILSGAESYRDIARFMKLRLNTLNHWLGISWKGSPSKSLLGYVMGKLAPESVENVFREYSAELAKTNKLLKNSYAIDGNALPKKTFEAVKAAKGELIVQLKENQKELLREVSEACNFLAPISVDAPLPEKGRNRIEIREARVYDVSSCLIESADWKHLIACAICVWRQTDIFNTKLKIWVRREETAYFVASHQHEAAQFAKWIREHWRTENVNHHVRDVSFKEDASRIRVNPGVFARLRSFALNICRHNDIKNVKAALFENALAFELIKAYKGIVS